VPSLSSPGVGSNLDVREIVSQLMAVERQPLKVLDSKEASFKAKLTTLGQIKSALTSLQSAALTLSLSSTYNAVKPSVADSGVMSVAITGATPPGSYNVEVKQLAQAQKLISGTHAAMDSTVGTGTLKIEVGRYSMPDAPPVGFTPKEGVDAVTITIDDKNNTLSGIRDAINASGAGVTATIINDGSGYRLSLTSKESGEANEVRITASETGDPGLAQLAYDRSEGGISNLHQNVAARDAILKIDGMLVTKPTNTITDAIQGVTLTLTKETSESGTKLTLTHDTSAIRTAIDNFIKAYNEVHKQIGAATNYDATSQTASILTGDATMRSLQSQLRNALSTALPGSPGGMSVLSQVGIAFQRDGSLALDADKLAKAIADPNKDVSQLFIRRENGEPGFGGRIHGLVSKMILGEDALLNGRMDGINNSIKNLDKQRQAQEARMASIEQRYLAQFTALDVAISRMTSTSSFLTQQLEALKAQTK